MTGLVDIRGYPWMLQASMTYISKKKHTNAGRIEKCINSIQGRAEPDGTAQATQSSQFGLFTTNAKIMKPDRQNQDGQGKEVRKDPSIYIG